MKSTDSFLRQVMSMFLVLTFALPMAVFAGDGMSSKPKGLTEDQKILHVLNRLGFGARPGDVEKVRAMGLQKYIDKQLDAGSITDSIAEAKVKNLEVYGMTTPEIFAKYPNPVALLRMLEGPQNQNNNQANNEQEMTPEQRRERQAKIRDYYLKYDLRPATQLMPQIVANRVLRAVYSERQLEEVMVDFWQNHFNVFAGKAAVRWYIPSYERDVIRKNALGNFKDLVVGTAQHPAMLFFLDNFENVSPNATINLRGRQTNNAPQQQQRMQRGLNENYARELMELHTLGVDGGYSQQDIIEVAKCFTGWTIADPRGYRSAAAREIKGQENRPLQRLQRLAGVPDDLESGQFYFNPILHEKGAKTVLGQKVDEGGMKDGLKVIEMLVAHPSTAKFIARKLATKFVSDNPDPKLVDRVAKAFQSSKGDIKTTLKALFTDKDFFAPENYRAKIKTPFELAVSAIRTIGADTNGGIALGAMLQKLGEVPYGYQAPTGYPDAAEDWVNTGALLERLNYSVALASNRIPGTKVDLKRFEAGTKAGILDKTLETVLDNDVSAATRQTLIKQIEQPLPEVKEPEQNNDDLESPNLRDGQQQNRPAQRARLLPPSGNPEVFKIVSLVLGTPEFQRQ